MLKALLTGTALTLSALGMTLPAQASYPERSIQAIIPWGADSPWQSMDDLLAAIQANADTMRTSAACKAPLRR